MKSAGIVGMGIMGRVLALVLHQAGWQVSLFDEGDGDTNCSAAAAGLLCPLSELDKADLLIYHLGQASIRAWPKLISHLSPSIYFQQKGCIVVHHPRDISEWQHFQQRIDSKLKTKNRVSTLNKTELQTLEPDLNSFESAYYFPSEAQIDCQSLLPALKNHCADLQMTLRTNTKVLSLQPHRITTAEQSFHFDMVFDCRGLKAKDVFTDLRGIRGELLWLYAPEVQISRPLRLLHPRYSLYIVPRPGQIYLVGASEIEAEDLSPVSVQTTLELLSAVYYVHPGFAEARILKTSSQIRPTLANHLPRIYYQEGLIAVNGLYRHGYLLAPALAEEIERGMTSNFQDLHYPNLWEQTHATHLL